jgi:hypothetical protein
MIRVPHHSHNANRIEPIGPGGRGQMAAWFDAFTGHPWLQKMGVELWHARNDAKNSVADEGVCKMEMLRMRLVATIRPAA